MQIFLQVIFRFVHLLTDKHLPTMKIVAKTGEGFLISATEHEVKSILFAFGIEKPEPTIGLTIPAADFNATVVRLQEFGKSSDFRYLKEYKERLDNAISAIDKQLEIVSKL